MRSRTRLNVSLGSVALVLGMGGTPMAFDVSTAAFRNGAEIPAQYTCSGADRSPALTWSGVPAGAHALGLIVDDPDAPGGTWTHWLLWNVPVLPGSIPEGVPREPELRNGARQGKNDFGRMGYGGPCPPPGKFHRYYFRLFALDAPLDAAAGSDRAELERAMRGHILGKAVFMGTYKR